ncbi:MAG TPA: hypothetical protein VK796_05710 [Cytophaga sp.]|jgi:hypothetical protein|nr:hypothetical protein [Cytophaga sp.]
MLNFGLKRIVKKLFLANALWLLVFLIFEVFRLNSFSNLLDGTMRLPEFWAIYCIPTLVLIVYDFFYERIIRLEVKDGVLLVSGLKFFFIHTLKIEKEDITYKIKLKKGLLSKYMRYLIICDNGVEKYIIKEDDLNALEMDQTINFFRVHLFNAKIQEI